MYLYTDSARDVGEDSLEVWGGGRVCRVVGRRTRTNRLEVHQLSDGALLGNNHLVHATLQIS